MKPCLPTLFACCLLAINSSTASAEDWPRFLGPNASARSESSVPTEWGDKKNLRWKTELPGAGSSCPIVIGDKIFLTCFSGEGRNLKRHVVCVNRAKGDIAWTKEIEAVPDDSYRGFLTEHGYASNSAVSDGERLFVFLGKSGVFAFDLDGKQLWQVGVGTGSSNRRWGSAASLVLYKNTLIVNSSEESQSIRALDKARGKEVWKSEASSLELAYGTPNIVTS